MSNLSQRRVLVLVGEAASSRAAVLWAAHWSLRTGDGLMLLHVLEPEQLMNFGAVHDMVRAEQWQTAERVLDELSAEAERVTGKRPLHLIREGSLKRSVRSVLEEQPDLSLLVMAASHREAGPAPLTGYLASRMGSRVPVPLVLVPDSLTGEKIATLT
jgi:nucleotide-binding universal stress UspA family protein